jgi:hypothetical protein
MGSKSKSWSYVKGGDPTKPTPKTQKEQSAANINLGKEQAKKRKQFRDAEYGKSTLSSKSNQRNSLLGGL